MPAWSAPVRYAECDQQGVVFNAHYLAYADEAVAYVLAEHGLSYGDLLARGLDTSVVATELQWSSPARWGDVVDVDGQVERVGRTSFVVAFTISVGDRLCCRVRTTYVLTDAQRTPTPVPDDVRALWLRGAAAP
ncbi:MAG: putative thioesterase [Frankiales bacterium]|nr:putative thioesterase [Frankiales bacterium]